jgi:hypothetical protein
MKLFSDINKSTGRRAGLRAFSMAEMMVVVVVFSFVILAVTGVQIVAMRVYTLGATKISATTGARQSLNSIRDQVRSAKVVLVGTCDGTSFTQAPINTPQMGNALAICSTNAMANNYLVYYLDQTMPTTNVLYSFTNGVPANKTVLSRYMTNYYCFFAEDFQGNIMTNYVNNPVIHVIMQFSQWEYPIAYVGSGSNAINAYDFYTLNARIARRAK